MRQPAARRREFARRTDIRAPTASADRFHRPAVGPAAVIAGRGVTSRRGPALGDGSASADRRRPRPRRRSAQRVRRARPARGTEACRHGRRPSAVARGAGRIAAWQRIAALAAVFGDCRRHAAALVPRGGSAATTNPAGPPPCFSGGLMVTLPVAATGAMRRRPARGWVRTREPPGGQPRRATWHRGLGAVPDGISRVTGHPPSGPAPPWRWPAGAGPARSCRPRCPTGCSAGCGPASSPPLAAGPARGPR